MLACAGEEYTASGRPKRKRKNRTRKDKDYVFEGDDEFVDGDGEPYQRTLCTAGLWRGWAQLLVAMHAVLGPCLLHVSLLCCALAACAPA